MGNSKIRNRKDFKKYERMYLKKKRIARAFYDENVKPENRRISLNAGFGEYEENEL